MPPWSELCGLCNRVKVLPHPPRVVGSFTLQSLDAFGLPVYQAAASGAGGLGSTNPPFPLTVRPKHRATQAVKICLMIKILQDTLIDPELGGNTASQHCGCWLRVGASTRDLLWRSQFQPHRCFSALSPWKPVWHWQGALRSPHEHIS